MIKLSNKSLEWFLEVNDKVIEVIERIIKNEKFHRALVDFSENKDYYAKNFFYKKTRKEEKKKLLKKETGYEYDKKELMK